MDKPTASPFSPSVRNHAAEAELDTFFDQQRTPGLALQRIYPPTAFPDVRSHLGGLPQLPAHLDWPRGVSYGDEVPMHFMAQIDCAELPPLDSDMPREGMLFFFAINDEEQIWNEEEAQPRVRVLYAETVAVDQAERQPPADLRPIHDVKADNGPHVEPYWLLPGEDGPRVYTRWPLVARRMDTWPESDVVEGARPRVSYETYSERLGELRAGALVAATGLFPRLGSEYRWEQPSGSGWRFAAVWLGYQTDYPQAGIMIDRLARIIAHQRGRATREQREYPDVMAWVKRAAEIGWEEQPEDETRLAFREWVLSQAGEERGEGVITHRDLGDVFTKALLATIAYAGGSPKVAAMIPASYYRDLADEQLPFDDSYGWHKDGRRKCVVARPHQMLGHVRFLQSCGPEVDGDAVCLLQLAHDSSIGLTFGDCGQATFWITREDLASRRFEGVAAVVESG